MKKPERDWCECIGNCEHENEIQFFNKACDEYVKYHKEQTAKLQSQIETLEEYNRSKEKYIETLQKHYNEIYTENTKLLSQLNVLRKNIV